MIKQKTFDPLDYGSREAALKAKNEEAKRLRKSGYKVFSSILKNQLQKYAGFGIPDGRARDVFMINVYEKGA